MTLSKTVSSAVIQYHYAERHVFYCYAECHYAECRGAIISACYNAVKHFKVVTQIPSRMY